MKKFKFTLCLTFILSISTFLKAQIYNQTGTVYLNGNESIQGKINYVENVIKVKAEKKPTMTIEVKNIDHVLLQNNVKFVFKEVNLDVLKFDFNKLCTDNQTKFEKITFPSQVLVEADSDLYKTTYLNNTFYLLKHKNITYPLLNSKCSGNSNRVNKSQEEYKKTLYDLFKEDGVELSEFLNLEFNDDALTALMVRLNKNSTSTIQKYTGELETKPFSIAPLVGVRFNNYSTNTINDTDIKSSFINPNFGVDVAYSFNKRNTFSAFFRATVESFNMEARGTKETGFIILTHIHEQAEMKGLILTPAVGGRLVFIDKGDFRTYIDVAFEYNQPLSGEYRFFKNETNNPNFEINDGDLLFERDINETLSFSSGLGFSYRNFVTEFRFHSKRDFGNENSSGRTRTPGFIGGFALNLMCRF
jgi:hypothetical protein